MLIFKLISHIKYFKSCIYFFLMFSFVSNLQIAIAHANQYLISSKQENDILDEFY